MSAGVSGSLLPFSFLTSVWPTRFSDEVALASRSVPSSALVRWWQRASRQLGPASSTRRVLDLAALPLFNLLGYELLHIEPLDQVFTGVLGYGGKPVAVLLVLPWGGEGAEYRRHVQRGARTAGTQWAISINGERLQIADASRPWTRRALRFDLAETVLDERGVLMLWAFARAGALDRSLDQMARAADAHTVAVCEALGDGVLEALTALMRASPSPARTTLTPQARFDQALTLVYRVLFLLFAEARALVPTWHRVYRDGYTIDALYRRSTNRRKAHGLWDGLMAISRLAHAGCHAGDLRVTAFNGRLFSPRHSALAERSRIPDDVVRDTLAALTTVASPEGRRRIAFRDLGVEQLGAVYERVLEYEPATAATNVPAILTRTSHERKSTGSFYTPRSITEFLVRRTLHPLIAGRTADEILSLRLLDPAMGSGAFLVAACRYLAHAVERARIDAGEWSGADITADRRADVRREVAQRCLYGVDANGTAVQLARLSLWLTTLAADRPLTFLDHHLLAGDSLVGATLLDLARQPPGVRGSKLPHSKATRSLFDLPLTHEMASFVLPERFRIAEEAGDTLAAVRDKERTLARLLAPGAPLQRWKAAADLWCAGWFWPDRRLNAQTYGELLATLLDRAPTLAATQSKDLLAQSDAIARSLKAFHWDLEFPEVFFGPDGLRRADAGFDAVIGNPPWDVLRLDSGSAETRDRRRAEQQRRFHFFRDSGVYQHQSSGHVNCYQLFVERALQLVRPGGRVGLLLPSGIATDHGSAALRRALFDRVAIERLFGFTNRDRIFPIHRDVRFVLLMGVAGRATERVTCRFGLREASWLDTLPDAATDDPPDARPIVISRSLLERWDRERLAIPELDSARDLDILAQITESIPRLGAAPGWNVRFGRELNASDDRRHFRPQRPHASRLGLPIVEGKHVEPFRVLLSRTTSVISAEVAATLLDPAVSFARARIAYRDVASATNRLTLIAARLPEQTVSTHTLFCLKSVLGTTSQYCLLALMNSLVANYLVRLHVTTHVTASLMARLPVPKPAGDSRDFRELAALARTLEAEGVDAAPDAYVRLNTIAARLYGLNRDQYAHLLTTFPLLPTELREECLRSYVRATETRKHGGENAAW